MDELRQDARIHCKLEVKIEEESKWYVLYSQNISMSGILLVCETDLDKLELIGIAPEKEIILHFCPPQKGYMAKIPSKIIHVERKDGISHVRIHFSELSGNAKKDIEEFVQRPYI